MTQEATDHRRAIAERNVEAILDATEALLERRSPVTITAVAARAGVSRMTVYAHFRDQTELLEAVVDRAVGRWVTAAQRLELHRLPAEEALTRILEVGWEEISRIPHVADAAAAELSPDAMRRGHDRGLAAVRELTQRGRREGVFRTDVPSEWLVSAFIGLVHAAHDEVRAGTFDSATAHDALLATVPDLFRGRPEAGTPAPAGSSIR
jgi:TetR/AcrR family transcriptional repressor of mexCD-oprJ operon